MEKDGKEEMALVEDGETSDEGEYQDAEQIPTVQISMHALAGISSQARTFTLRLQLGSVFATALVDSGSDVSFVNAKFALK